MTKNIVIFGDSIAWGANDFASEGWVGLLRQKSDPDKAYIYNCSVSGDFTHSINNRIVSESKLRNADVIVLACGINDTIIYDKNDSKVEENIENFIVEYKNLVEISKKITKEILILGITPVDEKRTTPMSWDTSVSYRMKYINIYNESIKAIANEKNIEFLELIDVIGKNDLDDGLHPNIIGHKKIFNTISKTKISKFLKT